MINPIWSKQIKRAVIKHFKNALDPTIITVFSEQEKRNTDELEKWLEVRIDIHYKHLQGNNYYVTVDVDLLIMSVKGYNIFTISDITGRVAAAFSSIQVMDGASPTENPLFCLRLKNDVEDIYYGEQLTQANMEQATVEGIYESYIVE